MPPKIKEALMIENQRALDRMIDADIFYQEHERDAVPEQPDFDSD